MLTKTAKKPKNIRQIPMDRQMQLPGSVIRQGQTLDIAVNHGEGRFFTLSQNLAKIEQRKLVFCRYVDDTGKKTQKYPSNPNGSINAIARVCDSTGRILGLMPHPEKIVDITQHPNWRRGNIEAKGGFIFEGMIKFAKQR